MIQAAHVGVGISGVEVGLAHNFVSPDCTDCDIGLTSRSLCRCGNLAVPVPQEASFGSWSMELPTLVKVDPVYVPLSCRIGVSSNVVHQTLSTRILCSIWLNSGWAADLAMSVGAHDWSFFPQYSFFNNFSGQIAYESWTLSLYNVVFTLLPPLVIGVFDQFVSARILDRYPQLYMLGQRNAFFTRTAFWLWVGNALYHSLVNITSNRYLTKSSCWSFARSSLDSLSSCSGVTSNKPQALTPVIGSGAPRCT